MQSHRAMIVEPVGLEVDALPRPIVWSDLFGNAHPVEIEIGIGKGTFLVDAAKGRPDTNFLGIEYARWFWRYSSDRLRRAGCANARTVRAEAAFFLRECVPPASVAVLHIYFPDPWPKKRHHKRRLIQENFMLLARRILRPGGRVRIVTDHADYFQQMQEVIPRAGFTVAEYDRPGSALEGEFVGTNFERKYRRDGRPFFALVAIAP